MVKTCFYILRIISGKQSLCLRKKYKYTALKVFSLFSVILFLILSMPGRRCMLSGKTKQPNEAKRTLPMFPFIRLIVQHHQMSCPYVSPPTGLLPAPSCTCFILYLAQNAGAVTFSSVCSRLLSFHHICLIRSKYLVYPLRELELCNTAGQYYTTWQTVITTNSAAKTCQSFQWACSGISRQFYLCFRSDH